MRRPLLWALVLAPACAAMGQEAAVFELEDYVDPRILGTVFSEGEIVPGSRYLSLRATAGWVTDYRERNEPTQEDLGFARIALNHYRGASQWTLGVTALDASDDRQAPSQGGGSPGAARTPPGGERPPLEPPAGIARYRAQVRYGRYSPSWDETRQEVTVGRWSVAWTVEDGPGREVTHELAGALDVGLFSGAAFVGQAEDLVIGGLLYSWKAVSDGPDEYRVSYAFQQTVWQADNGVRVGLRGGLGGERTLDHWRWGSARTEFSLKLPIRPVRADAYLALTPVYRFRSRGIRSELDLEAAFFLDASILAKLF